MALFNLQDMVARMAPEQRLLGIDPGSKRIGLALSDTRRMIATPYATVPRGKLTAAAATIRSIAAKEGVGGLVVGWPLSMDGSIGPAAQAVRDWSLALTELADLPGALWDERLSSAAVNRFLVREVDLSRAKRNEAVDRAAAAWILQSALNFLA
jgi:putative Holliday junction resolvase